MTHETHDTPENETTSGEGAVGTTKAEGGSAAAPEGASGQKRARRANKRTPAQAGKDQVAGTLDDRDPKPGAVSTDPPRRAAPAASKLDRLVALLRAPEGASLPELVSATGWQAHSVRGAMAGALRKKGLSVISEKPEGGVRRYRIAVPS